MAEFLVELYLARKDAGTLERSARRARQVAELLSSEGTQVRYLRSIFMPEDETCFLLYEAGSAEAVCAAATRAELPFERVTQAIAAGETA
jgi:hypothetical protein